MNGNSNFSVDAIARQLFENGSAFVFIAFQELVEFALRKHHGLGELPKVKSDYARHRRFNFRLL